MVTHPVSVLETVCGNDAYILRLLPARRYGQSLPWKYDRLVSPALAKAFPSRSVLSLQLDRTIGCLWRILYFGLLRSSSHRSRGRYYSSAVSTFHRYHVFLAFYHG
jgi:hypothetical protein